MAWLRKVGAAAVAAGLGWTTALADEPAKGNDLRDFRIGMTLDELPEEGYGEFACTGSATDGPAELGEWADFRKCPADESGLREIRFAYTATRVEFVKANDKWDGTRVFGHPSIVSLLLDDEAVVRAIRVATDPSARAYMRKKAFLLGQRAKYHFSPATWDCDMNEPSDGETPIGGIYMKERCVNHFSDRVVTIDVDLYRTADQEIGEFVNSTRIEIRGAE